MMLIMTLLLQTLSYKGEAFRAVTKLSKRKRDEVKPYWKGENGGVSLENFKIAKSSSRHSPSRLCGPLDDLDKHIRTLVQKTHSGKCAVCGNSTAWKCGLCNKHVCVTKGEGGVKSHFTMTHCLASLDATIQSSMVEN